MISNYLHLACLPMLQIPCRASEFISEFVYWIGTVCVCMYESVKFCIENILSILRACNESKRNWFKMCWNNNENKEFSWHRRFTQCSIGMKRILFFSFHRIKNVKWRKIRSDMYKNQISQINCLANIRTIVGEKDTFFHK